ncbi:MULTISPECIES: DNA-binding protein [unclassified Pseudomonas]|uniref:DNA-binding protein n=2 Tax=unclassified Pseudomonas TaxID=196821 RepID=UPI002AC999B7|nr:MULTISPECIES: DNA-binding protein [unclassified Pseudomonas]MEB0041213.1 DNA-binding protein [Pseudomonas sp. MH10]MEB0078302.1 DNA-binding protein [Pseudomonas sp. MH10out]MEB0092263.1 DNA-binding protein [Pseudomonas sp. CCI4.2]MEB0101756.1 DNA-binding protein [Pseudomonas sp. CCI3.2]MEB0123340.1 DNA-binding protein [Pseudomonas sp. CCI1.2]
MMTIRTPEEARSWLRAQGISVSDFARTHGLDPATTYQVLYGIKKGFRGKSHTSAVALGMKLCVEPESRPDEPLVRRDLSDDI